MAENKNIILYGHPTCPMLPPVIGMLKESKVEYTYINIHQDEVGREHVREINNGYESVPTLVFPDGSTLTEPSFKILKNKLQASGYKVGLKAHLYGNAFRIFIGIIILIAVLDFLEVI